MEESLIEAGLTKNEVKVYLAMTRLGSASAGDITKKSGVHRRNVYDAIERLMEKGLIGYVFKNNKKYFEVGDPHHLLDILNEDKEKIRRKEIKISSIIPNLLSLKNSGNEKQSVNIYKETKGVRTLLEDILETGEENLVIGAHVPPKELKSYVVNYHKRRVKLGIPTKMMFINSDARWAKSVVAKHPLTEIKIMPEEFKSFLPINIYGNKVAIVPSLTANPIGILIESKEISKGFKQYFYLLWNSIS